MHETIQSSRPKIKAILRAFPDKILCEEEYNQIGEYNKLLKNLGTHEQIIEHRDDLVRAILVVPVGSDESNALVNLYRHLIRICKNPTLDILPPQENRAGHHSTIRPSAAAA